MEGRGNRQANELVAFKLPRDASSLFEGAEPPYNHHHHTKSKVSRRGVRLTLPMCELVALYCQLVQLLGLLVCLPNMRYPEADLNDFLSSV